MRVYCRVNGKLRMYEVDTIYPNVAITWVLEELQIDKEFYGAKWNQSACLAVVK
jgi:hypothetical protein